MGCTLHGHVFVMHAASPRPRQISIDLYIETHVITDQFLLKQYLVNINNNMRMENRPVH